MRKLIHGGDIYDRGDIPENTRIVDFSANINPLGMPLSVKKAIAENIDKFSSYPDPLCRALINEISRHEDISSGWIVCGNGAADIIYRLAIGLKPKNVLLTAPTFSEYEHAVRCAGGSISYHYLLEKNNFSLDSSILHSITPGVDMVFLCNPNNPTGIPVKKGLVLEIAAHCRENGTVLVVDECFMDFLQEEGEYSVVGSVGKFDNIIVLKAFTKIFAMAGIRLGYGICSNKQTVDRLYDAGQPWNVSVIAQICGIAALKETSHILKTKEMIQSNREYLIRNLNKLGFKTFESKANYVLFKTEDRNLSRKLLRFGILIRSCGNFTGLDNTYYRIAVKSHADNEYLIKCLGEVV
ncbi:MAG TPA: histidinol-phosphate transaminase [Ruminiclostridium sp.]|nr:histidinol-phosphate transaminase [Ruminiclostridium sp.]